MSTYTHNCTKCRAQYQDTDPDAYLCVSCLRERQELAKQIDAQMAGRPAPLVKSDLQEFEEKAVTVTTPDGRRVSFMRV